MRRSDADLRCSRIGFSEMNTKHRQKAFACESLTDPAGDAVKIMINPG